MSVITVIWKSVYKSIVCRQMESPAMEKKMINSQVLPEFIVPGESFCLRSLAEVVFLSLL